MTDHIEQIVAALDAISSVDDEAQLKSLDRLIATFFTHPDAPKHVGVWFRLFERFPEDDAYEMFWSVLHGIEKLPNYETELIASIRRRPSEFPVRMVNRMLNAGQTQAEGVDLMSLLELVANDQTSLPRVRESAKDYIEHQKNRY